MTEQYLTLELKFLVPIVLAVAVVIYQRDVEEELRALWISVGVAVAAIGLNVVATMFGLSMGLPATVCFVVLFGGYVAYRFTKR